MKDKGYWVREVDIKIHEYRQKNAILNWILWSGYFWKK